MHKAQKEIRQVLSGIDVAIEILDARIPFSSQNPLLDNILGERPRIRLLNKADLADPDKTRQWQQYLNRDNHTHVEATALTDDHIWRELPGVCRQLTSSKRDLQSSSRPVHALITGIPNVGKSSIINRLAGRTIARTGNEPAVTKAQQRIDIGQGVILRDTPGVLWPNVENRHSGYRLAITGAIRDTAMDSADVASYALEFLLGEYPERLENRYQIATSDLHDPVHALEQIGRRRGSLAAGAQIDYDRAARIVLTDIRSGDLGPLTLELPTDMENELRSVALQREQKAAAKKARAEKRHSRRNR